MIAPIALVQVPQGPRPKREFHKLDMPMSQVFNKLKAKRLLKPLDPRLIPNPLPSRFDVNKRSVYHQVPGHDTDCCFTIRHAIQDLIDNKVIAPPTRPSIIFKVIRGGLGKLLTRKWEPEIWSWGTKCWKKFEPWFKMQTRSWSKIGQAHTLSNRYTLGEQ